MGSKTCALTISTCPIFNSQSVVIKHHDVICLGVIATASHSLGLLDDIKLGHSSNFLDYGIIARHESLVPIGILDAR